MNIEIIIPTIAGRETYLRWCIESCLNQTEPCMILVSSNGGDKGTRDLIINSFNNPLVRLVETEKFMPMASHWEFALSHAKGDIVTIIGDDDALMPDAIEKVNSLFKENDVKCVTHIPAQYYWPDYIITEYQNTYILPKQTTEISLRYSRQILSQVVAYNAHYGNLPLLYHGFVKLDLLRDIVAKNGGIFNRIMPDVYSDFLIASSIDKYLHLNASLTVGGQGAKSNGATVLLSTQTIGNSFFDNVVTKPKYCGYSVYLQVQEYIESIKKISEIQDSINPVWSNFLKRVIIEGIGNPSEVTRKEIFQSLHIVSSQRFPFHLKIISNLLINIFKISFFYNFTKFLMTILLQRKDNKKNALNDFNVKNIYDFSLAISKL